MLAPANIEHPEPASQLPERERKETGQETQERPSGLQL
jgi:hypothetical protein